MEDFGDINIFMENYKPYIKQHMKDLYKKFESYKVLSSTVENIEEIIPDFMDINMVYYNCEGVDIPDMKALLEIIEL